MRKKLRVKKIVKRIAGAGKEVFVKEESETVKAEIRTDIFIMTGHNLHIEKILGRYKFSIKELEDLKKCFMKK